MTSAIFHQRATWRRRRCQSLDWSFAFQLNQPRASPERREIYRNTCGTQVSSQNGFWQTYPDGKSHFTIVCRTLTLLQLASSEARPTNTASEASSRVSQMLNLRNIIKGLPSLRDALQGSRSQLLQITYEVGAYHEKLSWWWNCTAVVRRPPR